MYRLLTTLFSAVFLWSAAAFADVALIMAEEPGCIYCARWNSEIGHIYPKTAEGQTAPLRRIDVNDPIPQDVTLARQINFTPTFVLLVNGEEVSRLEGYPGEDFFWGLLEMMLKDAEIPLASQES